MASVSAGWSRTIRGVTQVPQPPSSAPWRQWATAAALLLILVGAVAARFIDLETNPGGLYPDEATEAMSGRQILRDPTYRPVFIVEGGGREALYAYTLAAGFAVFGDNTLTVRAVAAAWGVLGVLGIWLLARRYGPGAGLAAAAWAAGSLWLIAISRVGMRNTITPLFCAIALLVLLAWRDRPSRGMAILAGGVLSISTLYTYQALKLIPLLVVFWLLWVRRTDPATFRTMARQSGYAIAAFLVVGAPMIAFAIGDPQAFLGRAIGVSGFNPEVAVQTNLVDHILRTLGMFAFFGDPNARHNVAALPALSWPLVGLAALGLWVAWRSARDARHALILLSLPVFLVPPLIATEGGSPHFLRALGVAAPLAVVVGVGAQDLARRLSAGLGRSLGSRPCVGRSWGLVPAVGLGLVFLVLGASSTMTYLDRPVLDRYVPFSFDLAEMANVAEPTDVVIATEFDEFTLEFVHDDPMPVTVRPGQPIDISAAERVLAVRVEELRAAVGADIAATAEPLAWDPLGQPTVWAVTLR